MKDGHIPRGQWPNALAVETLPDSDGVVRQVFVRSADGVFRSDSKKLCLLEEDLLKEFEAQDFPVHVFIDDTFLVTV